MAQNALVLLSGGLDSAVSLYWAIRQGWIIRSIEFEYHLRPERERRACRDLREKVNVKDPVVVPVEFLRELADMPPGTIANPALEKAPEGYIPSRNLIFYSISAYYAEILNCRHIVGGHTRTDCEAFPDAGSEFFRRFGGLLKLGMYNHPETATEVVLPLMDLGKSQVINLGSELGVPFELTWSCYFDREQHCGRCESCVERRQAFAALSLPDPITYEG